MTLCRCREEFPARHFATIPEADEFLVAAESSGIFVPVNKGKSRFGCRSCGERWEIVVLPHHEAEWRLVPPWPPVPLTSVVHRERFRNRTVGKLRVSYPPDAAWDLDGILDAIRPWTSRLEDLLQKGELAEVRVTIGVRLIPERGLETVYRQFWNKGAMDPAWWGRRAVRGERAVEIQGIREWSKKSPFGFTGELDVMVVNTRAGTVRVSHQVVLGD